ncbi:PhoH family protein [Paraburkholderia sp. RCC_158]|uniref:PhoH family protein n=1 Tax=Paraburkholderia sp. RCC_158 TaxID=3239220 RepID=UPI0035254D35
MAKQTRRAEARNTKQRGDTPVEDFETRGKVVRPCYEPIRPRTDAQGRYIASIKGKTITFATGPAGTGKTWVCASLAAEALREKQIEKIIVTRPAVEAGESLGFLPGEMEEKFAHYLIPFEETLIERLGTGAYEYHKRMGNIEGAPLAYMRGRTFKNALVILDESQNTTPEQMKMFLTRIGENCRAVVNGDLRQKDIRGMSGLEDAVNRLSWIPSISVINFKRADIVRSGIVQEIVESYERAED